MEAGGGVKLSRSQRSLICLQDVGILRKRLGRYLWYNLGEFPMLPWVQGKLMYYEVKA